MKPLREAVRTPMFWLGLALIAAYWAWVHPLGGGRGYIEDFCGLDMVRGIMSDNLRRFGAPVFRTDAFMAPGGAAVPYMSWSIEETWLGILGWRWDPDFPMPWAHLGLSLLICYLGSGAILRKMNLGRASAWGLAAASVLFHFPRHFKTWQHYSHILHHWAYLSLFLDAWIWQRLWRERRWSWGLEAWRGWLMAATLLSTGYNWGVLLLEWVLVRFALALTVAARRRRGIGTEISDSWRRAWLPVALTAPLLAFEAWWFLPLGREARALTSVYQEVGWFAPLWAVFRPLWLEPVYGAIRGVFERLPALSPVDFTETVVTLGWVFWIPVVIGLWLERRRKGGPGLGSVAPFLVFLAFAIGYLISPGLWFKHTLQHVVPFLAFFRVASRWGLYLPPLAAALIALCWPELSAWFKRGWSGRKAAAFRGGVALFALMALGEGRWLASPVRMMPPLSGGMHALLDKARAAPGTTVLDLPFCVAGGNGVCTWQECPNYPYSTAGQCFRGWHGKKVYGLYQGRMAPEQCTPYLQEPLLSWFAAWREQRCFTPPEWDAFCGYLDAHREIGAVLLYPEIWSGARSESCLAEFSARLGPPQDEAQFFMGARPGGEGIYPGRVRLYGARCRSR